MKLNIKHDIEGCLIMALKPFRKLPVHVRKSRENLYEYIRKELESGASTDETPEPEPEVPATYDIGVTINDGTDPVQGASVVIGETSKTTGSAGGCSFTGLEAGEYSVTVTADGYTEATETITVAADSLSFTISLTAAVADTPGE